MKRILTFVLALLFLAPAAYAQTPEALLQQGLRLERTSGDYTGAIEIYRGIIANQRADRRQLAKAWVQMGRAYESLGRDEARRAYETVLEDFSDQDDLVAEARDGLQRTSAQVVPAATIRTPGKRTITSIPQGFQEWGAALSPRGTYLVGWDHDEQQISLVNRANGSITHLRPTLPSDYHKEEGELYAEYLRMSPDETQVAAGWWGTDSSFQEIRITDIEQKDVRVVFDTRAFFERRTGQQADRGGAQVHDWSADGKHLLVFSFADDGQEDLDTWMSLSMVAVDGSGVQEILQEDDLERFAWDKMCLTADNRYVVAQFVTPSYVGRYLVKIDVETGDVMEWRRGEGFEYDLLACDGTGNEVIYAVKALGTVSLVRADLNDISGKNDARIRSINEEYWSILGSRTGDLGYSEFEFDNTVYIVGIDRESGIGINWSEVVHRSATTTALWSADGSTVLGKMPGGPSSYYAWDLNTHTESRRAIRSDSIQIMGLSRTPEEGKAFSAMFTKAEGNSYHSLIYDLDSGEVKHFIPYLETHGRGMIMREAGPLSGEMLAWHREEKCLHRFDLDTFESEQWVCLDDPNYQHVIINHNVDFSKYFVLATNEDDESRTAIFILDVASETMTKVWEAPEDFLPINQVHQGLENELFFVSAQRMPYNNIDHIYRLDLETGEHVEILQDLVRDYKLRRFNVDPTGARAIILGGPRPDRQIQELLVVEDLFSASN